MSSFPYSVFVAIENLPATRKKQILIFVFVFKVTVVENAAKHCSQTVLPLIEKIGNKSAIH